MRQTGKFPLIISGRGSVGQKPKKKKKKKKNNASQIALSLIHFVLSLVKIR